MNRPYLCRFRSFESFETRKLLTSLIDLDLDGDLDGLYRGSWFENIDGRGSFEARSFALDDSSIAKTADFDGDGDLDILTSENRWYENTDGRGDFSVSHPLQGIDAEPVDLTIQDVGFDGDMDIVAVWDIDEFTKQAILYVNVDGKGHFQEADRVAYQADSRDRRTLNIGDIEGDGDLDIVLGYGALDLRRNNGDGSFEREFLNAEPASAFDLKLIDIDQDGLLDIFTQEWGDSAWWETKWYRNSGSAGEIFEAQHRWVADARLIDLDGDRDLDLFHNSPLSKKWAFNDGSGNFVDEVSAAHGWFQQRAITGIADLNGDGVDDFVTDVIENGLPVWHDGVDRLFADVDAHAVKLISLIQDKLQDPEMLVSEKLDLTDDQIVDHHDMDYLMRNILLTSYGDANLDRTFDSADFIQVFQVGEYEDDVDNNSTWADGDWNSDGDFDSLDFIFAFTASTFDSIQIDFHLQPILGEGDTVIPVDLDGDGDIDLIANRFESYQHGTAWWYENIDGQGTFSEAVRLAPTLITNLGDADGDGDMDLFGHEEWYENLDEVGEVGPKTRILPKGTTGRIDNVGDIDGDGDLDVHCVRGTECSDQTRWFENVDGLGDFVSRGEPVFFSFPYSPTALVDMDNDTDLDLLITFTHIGSEIYWKENDGSGRFSGRYGVGGGNDLLSVTPTDIDGDGDFDVVASFWPNSDMGRVYSTGNTAWFENVDGKGKFDQHSPNPISSNTNDFIIAADLDNDGDIDMALGPDWYENTNGKGTFSPPKSLGDSIEAVATADIDGDGDLDLITAGETFGWLENRPA